MCKRIRPSSPWPSLSVAFFLVSGTPSRAVESLPTNVAPNPSFESDAKRLGGWMPLGVEATNGPARVSLTREFHRSGGRSLQVLPGPGPEGRGRRFVASYNGGEDLLLTEGTNGVYGARTIALRLDEDVRRVTGSAWIRTMSPNQVRLSLVWTGRDGRRPAVVQRVDNASQFNGREGDWYRCEIAATRPIQSHQVQLWLESTDGDSWQVDDVEIRMHRLPVRKILVDQIGFEDQSETKVAILQSSVPLEQGGPARLVNLESSRELLRGTWTPCDPIPEWDRFHWVFDFSAVTNRGWYVVGHGQGKEAVYSPPFQIGHDLLRQQSAEPGYRFFYYQRCGMALPGFHAACHLDDARMPDGTHRDLSGGWHDAGDYNKYCGFAPEAFYSLALAHHRQPQLFQQWDRDTNGLPDILDETLWGGRFLQKCIDPSAPELLINTISTGYRFWDSPEKETDNLPGSKDDRPVTQLHGDRTWCAAGFAYASLALKRVGERAQAEEFLQLAIRLQENTPGNIETLAALSQATSDPRYRVSAQQEVDKLLALPDPTTSFRSLGEYGVEFPDDPRLPIIRTLAAKRISDLERLCSPVFRLARFPLSASEAISFQAYEDVNDWYVGGTMRHLDVAIEGALAAKLGVNEGTRLAENQIHWILGRNPFGVSLMEGVGTHFVPNYHHRYNTIPGNPRGAVPGAILNGIVRAWPHQDRPWLDMTAEPNADYHCNEPWLPYNNRWMMLLSVW